MLLKAVAVEKLSVDLKISVMISIGSAGNELADMADLTDASPGSTRNEFADMADLTEV